MNTAKITGPLRLLGLIVVLSTLLMQPLAQGEALPLPPSPEQRVNIWAVTLTPGANPFEVAARMGLVNAGPIPGTPNTYAFREAGAVRRAGAETVQSVNTGLSVSPEVVSLMPQALLERYPRVPSDPQYPNQWHLNNTGQFSGTAGEDANVAAAWDLGYTGDGVVVSSVDDGLWHTNPDIAPNYLSDASWDFVGNDGDPSGGGHGTSVGGVMAADDDGDACGVGAAYNAQLTGINLLDAPTDSNEAQALTYQYGVNDIYNSSWGPLDNGSTLEGPGPLTQAALLDGITNGRGGLGSIYAWAAGNGKGADDDVNADGYANSRYTISVAATTNEGESSWYSEHGAPNLINAPSNGGTASIYTTAGSASGCTTSFGGTSSAAPLAAGVIALILEANPGLTWRDVQHILVNTAEKNDPTDTGWVDNGAGYHFNHYYGFGRVDAAAAASLAFNWINVEPEVSTDSGVIPVNAGVPDGPAGAWVSSTFNVAPNIVIESVDVIFDADHSSRGDLVVELISPSGMTSVLMHGRTPDNGDDYNNWRMGSVAHWGEFSTGTWTLRVRDRDSGTTGTFNSWRLQIYGTATDSTLITRQPESSTVVLIDEPATVSVDAAGGEPITYQWYTGVSGDTSSPIPGAMNSSYTTPPLGTSTEVWVRATGTISSMDSATAALTVVNEVTMLADPVFNDTGLNDWRISSGEGSIVCGKKFTSPSCAFKIKNKDLNVVRLNQTIDLNAYPWSLRAGDTLSVDGMFWAKTGINAKLMLVIRYADGTGESGLNEKVIVESGWQPLSVIHVLTRTDITHISVRVKDKSQKLGARLFADDIQVMQQRGAVTRSDADISGGILPPPVAPDGFRGNN